MLPTTSNEGINGTWNPGMVSTAVAGNIVHTFTPVAGQCANSTTMTVVVNASASPTFSQISPICEGQTFTLPTTSNNGVTGTWSPAFNALATTTYTFIPTSGQCAESTDLTVQVNSAPLINVLPPNPTIALGGSIQLSANGANTYVWTNGTTLSCVACPNPIANPIASTTYTVTGTNANGCSDTAEVTVFVDGQCNDVFIPTRFSPNENGPTVNNEFRVFGNCIESMKISIYDRWGERVFESVNQAETWDGTFKGKPLNSGAYVYTFSATLLNGILLNTTGSIEILR
jgi:gliding motility-associated-like protein